MTDLAGTATIIAPVCELPPGNLDALVCRGVRAQSSTAFRDTLRHSHKVDFEGVKIQQ